MFKTFNKISHLNSYILFGSVHCSRQSSNRHIYVVPLCHLNTDIEEPININISLNRKKYVIITIIRLIIMVALWNRADHYISMLWFVLSSSSSFFFFLA